MTETADTPAASAAPGTSRADPGGPAQRLLLIMLAILMAGATTWLAVDFVRTAAFESARATGRERIALYESTLRAALEKYRYLPFVVTRNRDVTDLVAGRGDASRANSYLEQVNAQAGAAALYVLDSRGLTLAASNWRSKQSFVGHNYSFRPYFRDAMEGRPGGFFAIGATTGEPGYFMSWPIYDLRSGFAAGEVLGVAVVKVDLDPLQQDWRDGGETVFVSDSNGVIFLSSRAEWKYRTLELLRPATLERIRKRQQYGGADLKPVDFAPILAKPADSDSGLGDDLFEQGRVHRLDGAEHLLQSRRVGDLSGNLHYLFSLAGVNARVSAVAAIMAISWILLFFALLFLRERRLKAASARRAREAMAIREVNTRLQAEIEERRRTERELRATQNELVQAGKLAALGQMSAAIAHELNQPLAAIQTFLAGSRIFLKRGNNDQVDENLSTLSSLADRMAAITGQLKTFARKSEGRLMPVVLQDAVRDVLNLLDAQIRLETVSLSVKLPEAPITVLADDVRIGQVLLNFIRNAMDAMKTGDQRELTVTLDQIGETALLAIEDTGHGISAENLERLFDPFFTTKEVGEGIGLGLSISYGIVTDLGGTLQAENKKSGGARFTIRLPLMEGPGERRTALERTGTGR